MTAQQSATLLREIAYDLETLIHPSMVDLPTPLLTGHDAVVAATTLAYVHALFMASPRRTFSKGDVCQVIAMVGKDRDFFPVGTWEPIVAVDPEEGAVGFERAKEAARLRDEEEEGKGGMIQ